MAQNDTSTILAAGLIAGIAALLAISQKAPPLPSASSAPCTPCQQKAANR